MDSTVYFLSLYMLGDTDEVIVMDSPGSSQSVTFVV